jgi:opacity protein-like surface antigen
MEQRNEAMMTSRRAQTTENHQQIYVRKPRFFQRFSAGVMASSLAMANSKSAAGVLVPQVMLSPSGLSTMGNGGSMIKQAPQYLPDFEERTEHKAPLTFGLKLGYSITPRMWVESGVQYSKLSSTFVREMRGSELTSEQALHYVGVPLGVGYRIFDVGPLSFYGVAGAQADFNVKAKSSTEGVETEAVKDDVQFSANAALGAQVKLTPHLGIYVEPGARYYFDNGSNVQNYFKDKKLNFNLQVGARWNIGKK